MRKRCHEGELAAPDGGDVAIEGERVDEGGREGVDPLARVGSVGEVGEGQEEQGAGREEKGARHEAAEALTELLEEEALQRQKNDVQPQRGPGHVPTPRHPMRAAAASSLGTAAAPCMIGRRVHK